MWDLDQKIVQEMDIENAGWTIYKDDGWTVSVNGLDDVEEIPNILQIFTLKLNGR